MEELNIPLSIVDCQYIGDAIKYSIGSEIYEIRTEPCPNNTYKVVFSRCDSAVPGSPSALFTVVYNLTHEEHKIAVSSSMNDHSIFVHNIDGLMAIRVARDIFSYLLISLGNTGYNECMKERCTSEWCDYLHYLIKERMDGRAISPIIIGK